MISVIATAKLKPGTQAEFLKHLNANVPAVREEQGCLEYFPAIDVASGIGSQVLDSDSVTVIEKWESIEALQDHLAAPHMVSYKEKVKDLVVSVTLKILQPTA